MPAPAHSVLEPTIRIEISRCAIGLSVLAAAASNFSAILEHAKRMNCKVTVAAGSESRLEDPAEELEG